VYWESKLLALSDLICMLEFKFTLQDLSSDSFDFLQATPEVVQVFGLTLPAAESSNNIVRVLFCFRF